MYTNISMKIRKSGEEGGRELILYHKTTSLRLLTDGIISTVHIACTDTLLLKICLFCSPDQDLAEASFVVVVF